MSGHHRFSKLREEIVMQPGGATAIASAREAALAEIGLDELEHAEVLSTRDLPADQ